MKAAERVNNNSSNSSTNDQKGFLIDEKKQQYCKYFISDRMMSLSHLYDDIFYDVIELVDSTLAASYFDSTLRIWSSYRNKCLYSYTHTTNMVRLLELSKQEIAFGDAMGQVHVLNLNTSTLQHFQKGHERTVWCLIKLKNGNLATGSSDCTVRIWNTEDGSCLHTLMGHSNTISSICELQDGEMATCSLDNTVKIWKRKIFECKHTFHHAQSVQRVIELKSGFVKLLLSSSSRLSTI